MKILVQEAAMVVILRGILIHHVDMDAVVVVPAVVMGLVIALARTLAVDIVSIDFISN